MSSASNVKVDACSGWTTNLGQLIRQWWTSSLPLASTYQLSTSSMWRISTWTTWGSQLASVRFLTLFFSTSAASGKTLSRFIRHVWWTPVNLREDWDQYRAFDRRKPLSESVRKLQLVSFQILPQQLRTFLDLFKGLQVLEGKWFPSTFSHRSLRWMYVTLRWTPWRRCFWTSLSCTHSDVLPGFTHLHSIWQIYSSLSGMSSHKPFFTFIEPFFYTGIAVFSSASSPLW